MAYTETIEQIAEMCLKNNPCRLEIRYNEPMTDHCTFKTGGPADCWMRPSGEGFPAFVIQLLAAAHSKGIPVFILGGGANIVIADRGIRGIVLDTGGWKGMAKSEEGKTCFYAGTSVDAASEIAAEAGLSGMEFLAGMPGSIGGAVWMNARCYGTEIADILIETEVIDFSSGLPELKLFPAKREEFFYKHSPFQKRKTMILSAAFQLMPGEKKEILAKMHFCRNDRQEKGHFRYPSAGSVFKNTPELGKAAGKIIDDLGLRGLSIGGAQVAPWHGNFIVNTGKATSADIRSLVCAVSEKVKAATGFILEPEIIFTGEWI